MSACTHCGKCTAVCPTRIVAHGERGYPIVDFRHGECTFCGECVRSCGDGALRQIAETQEPWAYRAAVEPACLAQNNVVCRTCADACNARAIRFEPRIGAAARPVVDASRCNGCGACVAPCPTQAIVVTELRLTERNYQ